MDFVTLNKRYLEHKLLSFLREHRRDFRHRFALPEDFFKSDLPMWLPKPETTEKPEEDIE